MQAKPSSRHKNRTHSGSGRRDPAKTPDTDEGRLLREAGRNCHDCGRLTYDYRCPDCLARWRIKHDIEDDLGEQEWWAL